MPARNSTDALPPYTLHVDADDPARPYWVVMWRHRPAASAPLRQRKRRVGPAWLDQSPGTPDTGTAPAGWAKRRGKPGPGFFDLRAATIAAPGVVAQALEQIAASDEPKAVILTFSDIATAYVDHRENVRGAKPATIRDYRAMFAAPGTPHRRGSGTAKALVMETFGDLPAAEITTRQINALLTTMQERGAAPRTIEKYRTVIAAVFNFACQRSTFGLAENPAAEADRRAIPPGAVLDWFRPEEIEAVGRSLAAGAHRRATAAIPLSVTTSAAYAADDAQDAEAVRLAAYTGLRRGELVALRWADVDFAGRKLTVCRNLSAGQLVWPKGREPREVPLTDLAVVALDRLSRRAHFTSPSDYVLCSRLDGNHLDPGALAKRYARAREAASLRPLRFHDLRHTFGSTLAAHGVDLVAIKTAMGHKDISTTQRYLHARPATEQADRFSAAFRAATGQTTDVRATTGEHIPSA